jgi:hypothetical protein
MKIVELKKAMDARFDEVDARFGAEHQATRRHMDMLVEQLKAEYRLGFDRMLTTDQRLASLDAGNASEHTTFAAVLEEHEVRIKALESPPTFDDDPPRNRR